MRNHYCPTDFTKGYLIIVNVLFRRPTMLCGVEIVNTLTSAAACTATRGKSTRAFPVQRPLGRGEMGVVARRVHSPPFQGVHHVEEKSEFPSESGKKEVSTKKTFLVHNTGRRTRFD